MELLDMDGNMCGEWEGSGGRQEVADVEFMKNFKESAGDEALFCENFKVFYFI